MPERSCAGLGRHQVAVAGQHVATQGFALKRTAAGRQHNRFCAHDPRVIVLAANACGPGDGATPIDQQFEGRAMVEDGDTGATDTASHEPHVFRALQRGAARLPGVIGRKRIAPLGKQVDRLIGAVEDALHPPPACRYPPIFSRLAIAAARFAGSGGTYQTPVPDGAVAPEVPQ